MPGLRFRLLLYGLISIRGPILGPNKKDEPIMGSIFGPPIFGSYHASEFVCGLCASGIQRSLLQGGGPTEDSSSLAHFLQSCLLDAKVEGGSLGCCYELLIANPSHSNLD